MDLSRRFILIINLINKESLSLYLKYGIEIFILNSPDTIDSDVTYQVIPDGYVGNYYNGYSYVYNSYGISLRALVATALRRTCIRVVTSATRSVGMSRIPTENELSGHLRRLRPFTLRDIITHPQMLLKLMVVANCIHTSIILEIPTVSS